MIENLSGSLSITIKLLLIPVLVLAAILLYRLDRIISSGLHSAEMLENTAENVEKSSETVYSAASFLSKMPGLGSSQDGDDNNE